MTLTPLTELEAVNEILASIGESPVHTIENPTNVDVINCLRILRNVNRVHSHHRTAGKKQNRA